MSHKKYTSEMENWIIANVNNYRNYSLMVDAFSEKFDYAITEKAMSHKVTRLGLNKVNHGREIYTAEHREWLKEHINDYRTIEDVAKAFNEEFGINRTVYAIAHQSAYMTLHKKNHGQNSKNQRGNLSYPVGTEKIRKGKYGKPYIWVKVNDDVRCRGEDAGSYNRFWRAKHKLVWEEANGKIPKGKNIYFLDGNTLNCNLDNLILVDNAVNGLMLANEWKMTKSTDLNKTKLRWCEHAIAMKNADMRGTNDTN